MFMIMIYFILVFVLVCRLEDGVYGYEESWKINGAET